MLKKRLAITLFDALCVVVLATYAVLAFAPPAYAYVDPSVMTYAIQAFAGVAVALGAVAGVALRRTRKMLFKALHIDENARKDVEPDIHRLDENGRPIGFEASSTHAVAPSKKRGRARDGASAPKWGGRLVYALIVSVFFAYTVFVVAPLEIVASNGPSLIFGISSVWMPIALGALAVAAVIAVVLTVLRGRAFEIALLIVFSLGLGAYVQAMFFNSSLPAADGVPVVWSDYKTVTVLSAAAWIAIIVAPLAARHWFSAASRGVAAAISICLVVVQSVGLASLFVQPVALADEPERAPASAATKPVSTEEGLFDVSPKSNVVMFVLDTIDLTEMQDVMSTNPEVLDGFEGFTYYKNTVGAMCPTRWAIPFLLTGQRPQEGEVLSSYMERRYNEGTFLPDIAEQGYSIGLYSDSMSLDYMPEQQAQAIADLSVNVHPLESPSASMDEIGAVRTLWKCALYRDMPWLLKPPFWFYTDEVNADMVDRADSSNLGSVAYTLNDPAYYDALKTIRLSVKDDGHAGNFKLIHLNGVHRPLYMNEKAEDVGNDNATIERSLRGSFEIVREYIRQMKDLGLYDDSTIIVTSDHGEWYYTLEGLDKATGPILLVKPPLSGDEAQDPAKVSELPASHSDIHPTIIDAVGGDASSYDGMPISQLTDDPRPRYYIMNACDGKVDVALIEYEINGDALDFSAYEKSGKVWDAEL